MDNIAISVEHVKKIYKLYDRNRDRLKDALGFSKKPLGKEHYALNDVSFQVGQGETVGIIGTNGSGKSTILKIITGVLNPTDGEVKVFLRCWNLAPDLIWNIPELKIFI